MEKGKPSAVFCDTESIVEGVHGTHVFCKKEDMLLELGDSTAPIVQVSHFGGEESLKAHFLHSFNHALLLMCLSCISLSQDYV